MQTLRMVARSRGDPGKLQEAGDEARVPRSVRTGPTRALWECVHRTLNETRMRKHVTRWSHRIQIPFGRKYRRLSRLKLNRLNCLVGSGQAELNDEGVYLWIA
jgi:hypothetical protein